MTGLTGNNILAGSSGQGGYEIEQSLRFEDGDSAYLGRTLSSPTDGKVFTLSFWLKRGNIGTSIAQWFFGGSGGNAFLAGFNASSDHLQVAEANTGYGQTTAMVFRDVGNWYHITIIGDSTQASNDDRIKIYVNGSQVTTTKQNTITQNSIWGINTASATAEVGRHTGATGYSDGYIAEVNFVDGQALDASNFGETNLLTNQWIPKKYVGTYGTNGFYLNFSNSASLGADSSGNGNNFTPTNLAATDVTGDSPTNNFATFNPLTNYPNAQGVNPQRVWSEGNTRVRHSVNAYGSVVTNVPVNSGKWYVECCVDDLYLGQCGMGIASAERVTNSQHLPFITDAGSGAGWAYDGTDLWKMTSTSRVSTPAVGFADGDIMSMTLDLDSGTRSWEFFKNNVSIGSVADIDAYGVMKDIIFAFGRRSGPSDMQEMTVNFGQDSSFAGKKTAQGNKDANGKGDFYYPVPSGYLALNSSNLPDPSIALPGDHFNTVLYSGNSSTQAITGVGFQPDWSWTKVRNAADSHVLVDVVRGDKALRTNSTIAEYTTGVSWQFDSDGFTMTGTTGELNYSSYNYAVWNWKADNTSGSTNTDGTITSTVSANPTAGFSIVKYTGNATAGATVGHGLSQAPEFMLVKQLDAVKNWSIYANDPTDYLTFTANASADDDRFWNDTSPGASVFTLGGIDWVNASGNDYISYCFHSVEGYSKFGSYTGNGSTDGTFIYTGFKPAFVLVKSTGVEDWFMYDGKRDPINVADKRLKANATSTEATVVGVDFLSNGFKWRGTTAGFNQSGVTFIYMAFAESPFKYSNAR